MPTAAPVARRALSHDLARALALVAALMLWNAMSDGISERFELDAQPLGSVSRIAGITVGAVLACGGVVGLGCVL